MTKIRAKEQLPTVDYANSTHFHDFILKMCKWLIFKDINLNP